MYSLLLYSLLQGYVEHNGDTLVSRKHTTPEGHKLGIWVGNQRNTKESLTRERIKELNDLGFVWVVRKKRLAKR